MGRHRPGQRRERDPPQPAHQCVWRRDPGNRWPEPHHRLCIQHAGQAHQQARCADHGHTGKRLCEDRTPADALLLRPGRAGRGHEGCERQSEYAGLAGRRPAEGPS